MASDRKRIDYLDGLRGIMSINVVICHFIDAFYPQMYKSVLDKSDFLTYFGATPLNVFVNGNIAVMYFFMLTGFLVMRSAIKYDYSFTIVRDKIANRYLKYIPIVSAATLLTFITMKTGLQCHLDILDKVAAPDFLGQYCNFDPSIKSVITTSLYWTFKAGNDFILPFWTVKYDLIGYAVILIMALLLKKTKCRRLVLLGSLVVLSTNYTAFILGALLADICFSEEETLLSKHYSKIIKNKVFLALCFVAGLYFACCPMKFSSIYSIFEKIDFKLVTPGVFRAVGITMLTYVIINCGLMQRFLENRVFMFLGKISFSTYALHWPLMLTVTCGLFKTFIERMSYNKAAVLSFAITLPVTIGISYISWYFVENKVKCNVGTIGAFAGKIKQRFESLADRRNKEHNV